MKTTHRIAASLLTAVALASCAAETDDDDNDAPQENITDTDDVDETDD